MAPSVGLQVLSHQVPGITNYPQLCLCAYTGIRVLSGGLRLVDQLRPYASTCGPNKLRDFGVAASAEDVGQAGRPGPAQGSEKTVEGKPAFCINVE